LFDTLQLIGIGDGSKESDKYRNSILATLYYDITNKLNANNKNFDYREKIPRIDAETLTEEPIVVSFNKTTKFPIARELEFGITLLKDFDGVLERLQLPNYEGIDELVDKYYKDFKRLYVDDGYILSNYAVILTSYILSDELGLNTVVYLGREKNITGTPESVIKALTATAIYLEKNNFKGLLQLMFTDTIKDDILLPSMKRYTISSEFLEELNNNFLYSSEYKVSDIEKPVIIQAMTLLLNMIANKPLVNLLTGEIIKGKDIIKNEIRDLFLKLFSSNRTTKMNGIRF